MAFSSRAHLPFLIPPFTSFTSSLHPLLCHAACRCRAERSARHAAFSSSAAAAIIGRFGVERTKESSDLLPSLSPSLECFPLPSPLRLLFFARDSIMSTASPSPLPLLPPRSRFVFLPVSFAVHLQTQFSRASGPFRVALPTSHLGECSGVSQDADWQLMLSRAPRYI